MSTCTDIVEDTLRLLRVSSDMTPATSDHTDYTFRSLRSMLSRMKVEGYDIGVLDPPSIDANLHEPIDVTEYLKAMLAVQCSPYFSAPIQEFVRTLATEGEDYLERHYRTVPCEDRPLQETMPRGEGHGGYYGNYGPNYFRKGQRVGGK